MNGRFLMQAVATALAGAAAMLAQQPACAGDAPGYAPGLPGSQVMLYVSWPVGTTGLGTSTFGLRYDRASAVQVISAAPFPMALRHRSLVQLEFARGVSPRVLFDRRVTWDLGRNQLGPSKLVGAGWSLPTPGVPDAAQSRELP